MKLKWFQADLSSDEYELPDGEVVYTRELGPKIRFLIRMPEESVFEKENSLFRNEADLLACLVQVFPELNWLQTPDDHFFRGGCRVDSRWRFHLSYGDPSLKLWVGEAQVVHLESGTYPQLFRGYHEALKAHRKTGMEVPSFLWPEGMALKKWIG
jgi:hypothetical protein